jgi:hypothetical protein
MTRMSDGKRTPTLGPAWNTAGQPTAAVRPCIGGKAELMGETCVPPIFPPPLPASVSAATEVERLEDIVEGLGVAGVFTVGTLPMNHD